MKELEVIKEEKDRRMFQEIADEVRNYHSGMTDIQITQFVLNDIEFPTAFGQYKQAKFELINRYNEIVNSYYEMKKTQAKIKIKEEQINQTNSVARKELFEIEREELMFRLNSTEGRLKSIITEARSFYGIYEKYKHFDAMAPEQLKEAEFRDWSAKTKNMPFVFEERYGDNYMKKIFGEGYQSYLETRRNKIGLLPREVTQFALENILPPGIMTTATLPNRGDNL